MEETVKAAQQIIASNIYMTIATADESGKPWISPVFFAYDVSYNLFWVSSKNALHSTNIAKRSQVAIVIFDSTLPEGAGTGVYFDCEATALTDEAEIVMGIALMSARVTMDEFRVHDINEVSGTGEWRIYKAIPKSVSKLTGGTIVNGQYVDERMDITL